MTKKTTYNNQSKQQKTMIRTWYLDIPSLNVVACLKKTKHKTQQSSIGWDPQPPWDPPALGHEGRRLPWGESANSQTQHGLECKELHIYIRIMCIYIYMNMSLLISYEFIYVDVIMRMTTTCTNMKKKKKRKHYHNTDTLINIFNMKTFLMSAISARSTRVTWKLQYV